jgi:hypothetical protein
MSRVPSRALQSSVVRATQSREFAHRTRASWHSHALCSVHHFMRCTATIFGHAAAHAAHDLRLSHLFVADRGRVVALRT